MFPSDRVRFGWIATTAVAMMFLTMSAAGASCAEPVPVERALGEAETAFVGTVGELEHDGRVAVFTVEEVWRGDVGATVVVSGGPTLEELEEAESSGSSIVTSVDRTFVEGVRYLVVPYGIDQGVYLDSGCSVTQPFDSSLEQYRPEFAHPPTGAGMGTDSAVLTARVTLAALAGVGVGAFLINRIRRRGDPNQVAV